MKKLLSSAALAVLALTAGAPASAQWSDLSAWSAFGDVSSRSATGATLTTAAIDSGEVPLSGSSALLYLDLEPALGAVGVFGADTYEGSALARSFVADAGTTVSFAWTLSTVGYDAGFADRAFALIDGTTLVDFATVAGAPLSGNFSYTFGSGGSHTLAFGVLDVGDVTGLSTLGISGFSVSAVPEPGALALMLAGLGAVVLRARRRTPGG